MTLGQAGQSARELTTGHQLDQYEILDLISRGGMASVFKARDTESGSVLAIKVPHLEYEHDKRFRREEELGLRLSHPALVRVLKPREKSRPYIAMEYVEGDSLRVIMNRQGPMSTGRAFPIARRLCEALTYMHERGVVHRDLKPDNIIVTAEGELRILDLGIAQDQSSQPITWGHEATLGTPDYLAPERISGRRGDARADVYAVGVILYEMLTGHVPHESPNPHVLMHVRTTDEPLPPRHHEPGIDPNVEAIILRALQTPVHRRQASMAALLADLIDAAATARNEGPLRGAPRRQSHSAFLALAAAGLMGLSWLVVLSYQHGSAASVAGIAAPRRTLP
jgi:serine/threonine protein kinase